jgi:SAM-dependent methyltransferase
MPGGLQTRLKRVAANLADRLYGIDSQTQVAGSDLGYEDGSGYLHYQASGWLTVPGMFADWTPPPGPGDVFVDLGCGKGRPLIQFARRFPVDRVVGVEYDPGLADICRENLRRTQGRHKARSWEVLVGDARSFQVPDDATIVYIANPFAGDVFAESLERIVESQDRRPRPMRLAYASPVEKPTVDRHPRFRELPQPRTMAIRVARLDPDEFRRYEVVAPESGAAPR